MAVTDTTTVGHPVRTFVIMAVALFMTQLDALVVSTALPRIREDLRTGIGGLEWTVNAYTLTFAVFLMGGATLADRLGRRRLFIIGLVIFTAASAMAATAPTIGVLVAARAIQGFGGAIVLPLTLTMLSAAVPPEKRGAAIGGWGAVAGLAVALGPLIGGAVVQGASWQWIFWINVPIGVVLLPFALRGLDESRGASHRLDATGTALISGGLFGVVFSLVQANSHGWGSGQVLAGFIGGAVLLVAFVGWESRVSEPMLPLHLFKGRAFTMTNITTLLMIFGMFGSVFLLAQFLQTAQGYSPLAAGIRTLPWTGMPMIVAPIAGGIADKMGGRVIVAIGLTLQALGLGWFALVVTPTVGYGTIVPALVLCGIGNGMFYAPIANLALGSVRREYEGVASGANNSIRELGGVLGTAVLAAVFSARGGYGSSQDFVNGLTPAVWVGAAVVLAGAGAALLIPRLLPSRAEELQAEAELATA